MTAKPAGSPLYHTCQRIEPSPFLRPRLPEPADRCHLPHQANGTLYIGNRFVAILIFAKPGRETPVH